MFDFIISNKDYMQDFITRSTYHSNAIEGSTLTYAETYAIIYNDNNFKINNKEPREIYEAINHKKALLYVFDNINNPLSESLIKNINKIINQDIKDIEGYRKVNVIIKGSEHIPPKSSLVANMMFYFVYNYNNEVVDDLFEKNSKVSYWIWKNSSFLKMVMEEQEDFLLIMNY